VEAKIDAIITAASTLFAANGFDATSVHDIAARAGVAAGTIIYHFKSKENLLFIIARQALSGLLRALGGEAAAAAEPWAALKAMARAFFRHVRDNRDAFAVIFRDDPFLRFDLDRHPMADLAMLERRCAELISLELERGFKSGVFREVPVAETTRVLRGLWLGCAQALVRDPSLADPTAEVVAFMAGRLLSGRVGCPEG
jgi:TetR/AcrR family fatty acid metabolism transcriptional regulator